MKRAARSIRNGSSLKLTSGAERRAQHLGHQVDGAAERIDQRRRRAGRDLERHRVDGEVAAAEVELDLVGVGDVRLARVVGVRLGAEGRDLVDRARRAWRRSCRTARPGSRSRRPTRRGTALISAGRASVVKSRSWSLAGRRRAAARGRCRRPGTADARAQRTARPAERPRQAQERSGPGSWPAQARTSIRMTHAQRTTARRLTRSVGRRRRGCSLAAARTAGYRPASDAERQGGRDRQRQHVERHVEPPALAVGVPRRHRRADGDAEQAAARRRASPTRRRTGRRRGAVSRRAHAAGRSPTAARAPRSPSRWRRRRRRRRAPPRPVRAAAAAVPRRRAPAPRARPTAATRRPRSVPPG